MGVGHVHRGALVAYVDDADAGLRQAIPDRLDMPALQAEDAIHAARFQYADDPGGDAGLVAIGIPAFRAVGR